MREQTVGVKRFSLAGTTVSLCKIKEMGVHIPLRHKRPPLNSISKGASGAVSHIVAAHNNAPVYIL